MPSNVLPAVACAASLLVCSFFPRDARAESTTGRTDGPREVDAWQARRVALLAHLGVATPLGGPALSAEYAFAPWASAGLGVGTVDGKSANVAAMGRWRLPLGAHFGTGVGFGASYGRPFTIDLRLCFSAPCDDRPPPPPPYALAADAEVFLEGRADFGLVARLYGGLHQEVTGSRGQNGYAGIAVGWAF